MAENLLKLSVYFNIPQWNKRALEIITATTKFAEKYPASFGMWALCIQSVQYGLKEIAVIGNNHKRTLKQVLNEYIPLKVIQASKAVNNKWPMLAGKTISSNKTKIYICENYSCLVPTENFEEFTNQLTKHFDKKNCIAK